jgi:hypothetical protein
MRLNLSKILYKRSGISTECVLKLLKSFEKDGLIEMHKKDIVVVNQKELLEISKKG